MPLYGHQHSSSGPARYDHNSIHSGYVPNQTTPILGSTNTPGIESRTNPTSPAAISSNYEYSSTSRASAQNNFPGHSRSTRSESSPSGPQKTQFERQGEDLPVSSNFNHTAQQFFSSSIDAERGDKSMSASGGMSLPGALQPGRPAAVSSNTAPSSVPTLPPISTSQPQQFSSPSRSSTANHSHSYSHSSPAPAYSDYTPKYASTPTHKYMAAQTPQSAAYSPLGLADIRPRADSGNDDGLPSANPYQEVHTEPTNCNYLAPWAVYSFDWCKWPVHQHGLGDAAGKMAIGSYLEDGHNYVSILHKADALNG